MKTLIVFMFTQKSLFSVIKFFLDYFLFSIFSVLICCFCSKHNSKDKVLCCSKEKMVWWSRQTLVSLVTIGTYGLKQEFRTFFSYKFKKSRELFSLVISLLFTYFVSTCHHYLNFKALKLIRIIQASMIVKNRK